MNHNIKGYLAAIGSAIAFGVSPLLAMIVYQEGGDPFSLTFYRYLLSLPVLLFFIMRRRKKPVAISKRQIKYLLLIGLLGYGLTGFLLNLSYTMIPIGLATTLHFLYPVLVVVVGALFYKYQVQTVTKVALGLSLLGMLFFSGSQLNFSAWGMLLAILSSVTYTLYIVFIDHFQLTRLSIFTLTFILALAACIPAGIGVIVTKASLLYSLKGYGAVLALAVLTAVGGTSLFQYGIRNLGPVNTAILSTLEPLTSVVLGIFFLQEKITFTVFLGIVLIMVAAVLVMIKGQKKLMKQYVWYED